MNLFIVDLYLIVLRCDSDFYIQTMCIKGCCGRDLAEEVQINGKNTSKGLVHNVLNLYDRVYCGTIKKCVKLLQPFVDQAKSHSTFRITGYLGRVTSSPLEGTPSQLIQNKCKHFQDLFWKDTREHFPIAFLFVSHTY